MWGAEGKLGGQVLKGREVDTQAAGGGVGGGPQGRSGCSLDHKVGRPWWLYGHLAPKRKLLGVFTSRFPLKNSQGHKAPTSTPRNASLFLKLKFS